MFCFNFPRKRWYEILFEGKWGTKKRRLQGDDEEIEVAKSWTEDGVLKICKVHKEINESATTEDSLIGKDYRRLLDHCVTLRIENFQRFILPLLQKLINHPKNYYFNQPVDPVALDIPDYFERIEKPMDLGSIKSNLIAGNFQSLKDVIDLIFLVFSNAMTYNQKSNVVHNVAKEMCLEFQNDLGLAFEKHQRENERKRPHYCAHCKGSSCVLCGEKCLKLESQVIVCSGSCGQKIKKHHVYYVTIDATAHWCQKCYNNLPPVIDSAYFPKISKKDVLRRRSEEDRVESWVSCAVCGSRCHEICALLFRVDSDESSDFHALTMEDNIANKGSSINKFVCHLCSLNVRKMTDMEWKKLMYVPKHYSKIDNYVIKNASKNTLLSCHSMTPFFGISARSLASTKIGEFLESFVKSRLCEQKYSPEISESITIRLVSNIRIRQEVPSVITDNLMNSEGKKIPDSMPCKQKCILLFQEIDGVDVCLFCLYTHEFDSSCPEPNKSKVYIAYLDSVEYFRPMQARTTVYHEIMVGYLLWSQFRGFKHCHIWSCPPQRGDNFVFWCHPSYQRTPNRERLGSWYTKMLYRAESMKIVDNLNNLYRTHFFKYSKRDKYRGMTRNASKCLNQSLDGGIFFDENMYSMETAPFSPPVFEGDYWVVECLKLYRGVQGRVKGAQDNDIMITNRRAREVIKELMAKPFAFSFCQPVDPVALNIPTYYSLIDEPMDLRTIKENLQCGYVYSDLYELAQDVRLTFSNALKFNPEGHMIAKGASKLLNEFHRKLTEWMNERSKRGNGDNIDELNGWLSSMQLIESYESSLFTGRGKSISGKTNMPMDLEQESESFDKSFNSAFLKRSFNEMKRDENSVSHSNGTSSINSEDIFCLHGCKDNVDSSSEILTVNSQISEVLEDFNGPPKLGYRGAMSLMHELSKGVHRLKDDLFVVSFADPNSFLRENNLDPDIAFKLRDLSRDTLDPDDEMRCPLLDSRRTFLEVCQFQKIQFDSLRRAKHSSLVLLHYLSNPFSEHLRVKCSACGRKIKDIRWHCEKCVNFDLCNTCNFNCQSVSNTGCHFHDRIPIRVSFV